MDKSDKASDEDKIPVAPKILDLFLKGFREMDHDTKARFQISFGLFVP